MLSTGRHTAPGMWLSSYSASVRTSSSVTASPESSRVLASSGVMVFQVPPAGTERLLTHLSSAAPQIITSAR